MSFPDVDGDFETFFEPTRIWLFGKEFSSLKYHPDSMGRWAETPQDKKDPSAHYEGRTSGVGEFTHDYAATAGSPLPMPPKRIERTLRRGVDVDENGEVSVKQPQFFARIYSFSYEGHYYRLPRPLLFLVNKPGIPVGGDRTEATKRNDDSGNPVNGPSAGLRQRGVRPARFSAKYTGVEARDWDFSADIMVWAVDRKDLTVCLDVEIGNYQEILLDSMIASDRREDDRASRSRGDLIGRGAGSFRGDMIGPHQNK
jgi:hypothetical protein